MEATQNNVTNARNWLLNMGNAAKSLDLTIQVKEEQREEREGKGREGREREGERGYKERELASLTYILVYFLVLHATAASRTAICRDPCCHSEPSQSGLYLNSVWHTKSEGERGRD